MIDASHGLDTPVTKGRLCAQCGYSLDGLRVGNQCPECGAIISPNRQLGSRYDTLTATGSDYLARFRVVAMHLAFSVVLLVVARLFSGLFPIAGLPAALYWACCVMLITRPKPMRPGLREHPSKEMPLTRKIAWLSQLGWVVTGGLELLALIVPGTAAPVVSGLGELFAIVGVVGFIPLSIWLSELADWARDEGLGRRFRLSAFLIGLLVVQFIATILNVFSTTPGTFLGFLNILALWASLGAFIGAVLFVICLLQLAALAQNALSSAIVAEGKEERAQLKKLEAEARSGHAPPGEIRRPAGRTQPCESCGYDLTGLPATNPCPECGHQTVLGTTRPPVSWRVQRPTPPPIDTTPIPLEGGEVDPPSPSTQSGQDPAPPKPAQKKRGVLDRPDEVDPYELADD